MTEDVRRSSVLGLQETNTFSRRADKSLARPGWKQTRKHVRDARDFNNIEMRADINGFFFARKGAEGISSPSEGKISLFHTWSG